MIKKIVVQLSADNIFEIDVDADIFDNTHLEAATRAIECCKLKKYGKIRPIIDTWEKKDEKLPKKHHMLNSYWVLVNAACYDRAELLREKFQNQTNVDLSKEPISGHVTLS